jgi:hypothetical protein
MALPDYLQETAKDYAKQLTAATSAPIDTSQFVGRQFVAGEDPLQSAAITRATQGLDSYKPFLTQAQALTGPGAGTGIGSIASFQSPFQQQVIDETLRQFDESRKAGLTQIGDQALDVGAFGGGRQGALEGQFMADTALGRAGIEAQLRQQGFADAASRRAQALQDQFALSNFQRQNEAANIANLGQLGAFRQGLDQSRLQADATAAQTAAFEPFQRLQQYGSGLSGLAGFGQTAALPSAAPSPFSTALSTALGIGGLFGKFR